MARTGERDEGEVKGVVSHNSNERNELIRLRGTRSHLLFTQRSHTNLLNTGSHLDQSELPRKRLRVPSGGVLIKII